MLDSTNCGTKHIRAPRSVLSRLNGGGCYKKPRVTPSASARGEISLFVASPLFFIAKWTGQFKLGDRPGYCHEGVTWTNPLRNFLRRTDQEQTDGIGRPLITAKKGKRDAETEGLFTN